MSEAFGHLSRLIFLGLILMLGGCNASLEAYPDRPFDNGPTPPALIDSVQVVEGFYAINNENDRRLYRDKVISERMAALNIAYQRFEEQLFQEGTLRNIATDWALLGLAGAGATVGSSATKTILAAVSGGLVGARASFDKNAMFDRALPSLVAKMEADRQQVELRLLAGMQTGTDAYGIMQALDDLNSYYAAGTLPGAILGVAGDAGVLKTHIEQERSYSFKSLDDPAKSLITMITGTSGLDSTKVQQLRTCFSVVGLPSDTLLVDFLYGGEFIAERSKALSCMRAVPAPTVTKPPPTPIKPAKPVAVLPQNPSVGAGTPSDQLRALITDPNPPHNPIKGRVSMAVSCYPASLDKNTTVNDLILNRAGTDVEKQAIIDCMQKKMSKGG